MNAERRTPNRRDVVRAHPLREALLTLIDRDGTTTSTVAARELGESTGSCSFHLRRLEALGVIEPVRGAGGRVKPWRRVVAEQATLNRELEDTAYASWLTAKTSDDEDFAFSEVVMLAPGDLTELRARLHRVLHDFTNSKPPSSERSNSERSDSRLSDSGLSDSGLPDSGLPADSGTPTAVIIRAFPLRAE